MQLRRPPPRPLGGGGTAIWFWLEPIQKIPNSEGHPANSRGAIVLQVFGGNVVKISHGLLAFLQLQTYFESLIHLFHVWVGQVTNPTS